MKLYETDAESIDFNQTWQENALLLRSYVFMSFSINIMQLQNKETTELMLSCLKSMLRKRIRASNYLKVSRHINMFRLDSTKNIPWRRIFMINTWYIDVLIIAKEL